MANWQPEPGSDVKLLTDLPVPGLLSEQLALFRMGTIHAEAVMSFDPAQADTVLLAKENFRVLGSDFGGDKGSVRLFSVKGGKLALDTDYSDDIQGNDGEGYLATIQKAAEYASSQQLPLGLSWGGPLDGTKLVFHPKATAFCKEVEQVAEGDLARISPALRSVINDGPAGLISGAVAAYQQHQAKTVLFIINGGGIGLAVLKDGQIYATEAGHVEGYAGLNTYNQTDPCGVFDATHICVERLGANKAGIEAQWQAATSSYMRARDIEDQYKAGNELAAELYDHSALVIAHVLQGTAQAFGINLADPQTVIVGHGGAFKFPQYGARIQQILDQHVASKTQLILTKDYVATDSNACIDGAAIAALLAD